MFGSYIYLKGCNVIVGRWLLSDVVAPKGAIFSDLQCNVESIFDEAGRNSS